MLQADLWKPTVVVFNGEDGIDDGGLSVEMHAAFWKGVTAEELKLFKCAPLLGTLEELELLGSDALPESGVHLD